MTTIRRPARRLPWLLLVALALVTGPALAIDARYSAHWFAPERSGEGWMLEILSPQAALLYWFTYDEQGNQRWLTALGAIDGQRIEFPELALTTGGRFGAAFDPAAIQRTAVGTAWLQFVDCNAGQLGYTAFGQTLVVNVVRLTATASVPCGPAPPATGLEARAGQGGSWFDPDRSGEGWSMQWMDNGQMLMIWYTFDPAGQPYWILGIGTLYQDVLVFHDAFASRGARFGAPFDPDDVERFAWGQVRMTLGCTSGTVSYRSTLPGFGEGGYERVVQLARPFGLGCAIPPEPDLAEATWATRASIGPALSELPAVTLDDAIYLAGGLLSLDGNSNQLWRYRPADDSWQRLADMPVARDHVQMAALPGRLYVFGGFAAGPLHASPQANVWRYDVADDRWTVLPDMPRARAAGGAAVLDGDIYLAGDVIGGLDRYRPSDGSWTAIPMQDHAERDHAAVVAYRGDLWLLGGRNRFTGFTHGEVRIVDPRTGQSRIGPPMPSPRSGFAAAVLGNRLVVTGGEALDPVRLIVGMHFFDPAGQGWFGAAAPALDVHGGPGATWSGRMFELLGSRAAGGVDNPGRTQVLTPAPPP
jgi:hypothetical protein